MIGQRTSNVTRANRLRYRAMMISREVKHVFMAVPDRFAKAIARRWLLGLILRWLFLAEDGKPHRAGEIVLAELRRDAGLNRKSNFSSDSHVMAYREGVRSTVQALFNYLNLDESDVRNLMELDDELE